MNTAGLVAVETDEPMDAASTGASVPMEMCAQPITLELWARLKRRSKYYRSQGLDGKGKALWFPVESLFGNKFEAMDPNGFNVRFNHNQYPLSHVELYVSAHGKMHRLK